MSRPLSCPSGKQTFATWAAALWALVTGKVLGTNTYHCHECHLWHVTSHPKYKPKQRRRA